MQWNGLAFEQQQGTLTAVDNVVYAVYMMECETLRGNTGLH